MRRFTMDLRRTEEGMFGACVDRSIGGMEGRKEGLHVVGSAGSGVNLEGLASGSLSISLHS